MAPAPTEPTTSLETVPADPALLARVSLAGLLAWLMPGLGHLYVGDRARGLVCLITIVATFWTGVAIGGVQGTIDPRERTLWFMAQVCTGGNAGLAYLLRDEPAPQSASVRSPRGPGRPEGASAERGQPRTAAAGSWVAAEIGVHYTGVAGLLNVLVILDALTRAEKLSNVSRRKSRDGPGS